MDVPERVVSVDDDREPLGEPPGAPGGGVPAPPLLSAPLGSGLALPGPAPIEPPWTGVQAPPGPVAARGPAAVGVAVGEWPHLEPPDLDDLREASGVGVFRQASRSANTLLAYRRDWLRFETWCSARGVCPLPAEAGVVAAYLADAAHRADPAGRSAPWAYSPATLERWVATINKAHDLSGLRAPGRDPEVRDTLAGIRRVRATPPRRKTPLLLADLERILTAVDTRTWPRAPGGIRDRCLLVMGWVGAFRRDELASLTVGDVTVHPDDGLHVLVRISKTDQDARGRTYALPYAQKPVLCAPCAWIRWRAVVNAWDGADRGPGGRAGVMRATRAADHDRHVCRNRQTAPPHVGDPSERVFRAVRANGTLAGPIGGHAINHALKQAAEAAGYNPNTIGGHSLRAGFVTQAFRNGADAHAIMRQTSHRDPRTLEIYARESAPLVGNAVTQVGL